MNAHCFNFHVNKKCSCNIHSFIYSFIPCIDSLLHSSGTLEISQQLQRENYSSHMSWFKIFQTSTKTIIVINYISGNILRGKMYLFFEKILKTLLSFSYLWKLGRTITNIYEPRKSESWPRVWNGHWFPRQALCKCLKWEMLTDSVSEYS